MVKQEKFYRDSWIDIQLDHIQYNVQQLRGRLREDTEIFAVVKANAYGHGDKQVAQAALEAGATRLAVAFLDEALRLRQAGLTVPILVMGWVRPKDAPLAAEKDITVTFFQKEWLQEAKQYDYSKPLHLHMKWDTGMGRIGIRTVEELNDLVEEVKDERFFLEGLFTHFATADEAETAYYEKQKKRFEVLLSAFRAAWSEPVVIHTGNSAASMRFPEDMKHYVRFGISMYGLYPSDEVKKERPIDLKPAFSLRSRLVHVKKLHPGESVSYGATYTAEKEEWIGTIPLGYADGLIRKLQGSDVLVDGKRMKIVGRICMDQFMVKLDKAYPVGEEVTVIGTQHQEEITIDELADYLDTINYEIPCIITSRVPRLYKRGEQVVEIRNEIARDE